MGTEVLRFDDISYVEDKETNNVSNSTESGSDIRIFRANYSLPQKEFTIIFSKYWSLHKTEILVYLHF